MKEKTVPKLNASQLDALYRNSFRADEKIFAEMRGNVKMYAGEHYTKKGSKFWQRIRNAKELSDQQKIRLTKNHTKTICNTYASTIINFAPRSVITPNNEDEIQDQKTAELNQSIWDFETKRLKFRRKIRDYADSFIQLGEVHNKIAFNPDAGSLIGYEPLLDEDGEPLINIHTQEAIPNEDAPVMSGELEVEEVLAFNLGRCPHSQSMEESPYYIVRKMVEPAVVRRMLNEELTDDQVSDIMRDLEETFFVFDGDKVDYQEENKKVMLREHYYKPSAQYPNGYFYIAVRSQILAEGELPYGLWPFNSALFDKLKTSPRARSPIHQMRPFQIEINRAASGIATTQVTLGDDKLVLTNGAKMSHGGKLSGVRAITVTGGGDPKILGGRGGEQYLPYMESQIGEMYEVMNVREHSSVREGKLDPYAMLYYSMKNKNKFRKYGEEFEEFITDTTALYLKFAKQYFDENKVVPMVGRTEIVNISEFKNTEENSFRIKVEPMDNDAETMLGKQLAINHALQYVGGSLDKQDIGRMMRSMPMMNKEEAFGDMTLDYDNSKNDHLAMERGEMPMITMYDNHKYLISRAVNRIKKADFRFLRPEVQQLFQQYVQAHQEAEQQNIIAIQRAQQGFIPTEGGLVTVDFYVQDAEGKSKRARIPYNAIQWLIEQLNVQGQTLDQLEDMNQGALAQMATQMANSGQIPQN